MQTEETKPIFRLLKKPNGLFTIEWSDTDGDVSFKLGKETNAILIGHIERGLIANSYAEFMMFPKTLGLDMFDALTFTSDSVGVVCVMIGSGCSPKTASLFIDAASWCQATSFKN